MEYGLQLYSVRDFTQQNLENALKQVAEIGYKFVEFAGFFGHTAEEVTSFLNTYGLSVSGTHSSLEDLDRDFDAVVKYHHAIGNKYYILPGVPYATAAELDDTIAKINKYQPMLEAEGIHLAFHNHSGEFLPNKDGQIAHEELERRTNVLFEVDTYWAYVGGRDPVELITRLKDRIPVIHLKDGLKDGQGFALGEGTAPVREVLDRAIALGMQVVVESETLQPDGISEVTRCYRFLESLGR